MISKLSSKYHLYCSCIQCKREIIIQNLNIHHKKEHSIKIKLSNCLNCNKDLFVAKKFCNKSCAATYNNNNRDYSVFKPGPKPKSKIYKKQRDELYKKEGIIKNNGCPYTRINRCEVCQSIHRKNSKTCSNKCYRLFQSKNLIGKTGGWRNFGGNGIKGIYNGYLYQSSWELAWIAFHLKNNIPFRRCDEFFLYEYDGKIKKYYPDFYLLNTNTYIEIKGFWSKKTEAKIKSVLNSGFNIKVIDKNEISDFLNFYENLRS